MNGTRPMTRLVEELPVHLDQGQVAICTSLSAVACELLVVAPIPSDRTVPLRITTDAGAAIRLSGTPGEVIRATANGVVQRLDLEPASAGAGDRLETLLLRLRKDAHLALCAHEDVEAHAVSPGWERVRLPHHALPELDGDQLDLSTSLLGRPLRLPLLISGMTGGSERGAEVNRALASVAQCAGIAMGVGSQRRMLADDELTWTYQVRDVAPDIPLLANIGAVQLNHGVTPGDCAVLVDAIEADALCIHLNALQEMIQPEGERNFANLFPRIGEVAAALSVPVLLKETGCGMSRELVQTALAAGCAGVDVAGAGGTSWARVESLRQADTVRRAIGETFRDWGIPSAVAVAGARAPGADHLVIASGGIRSGLDMARALALGADVCGVALPFLRAVLDGEEAALSLVERLEEELRVAMFCSSAPDVCALREIGVTPIEGARDE